MSAELLTRGQRKLFLESIIAQHDDEDYSESGWVAVRIGDWAALAEYSHCSCFDTWADLTGGGISDDEGKEDPEWDWQGTPKELYEMALKVADPGMPGRDADPKDSDYDHLVEVYEQIKESLGKEFGR